MLACHPNCAVNLSQVSEQCVREMENCVAYCKAKTALTQYYKFDSFRPGQLAALLPVLHGRDVLALSITSNTLHICGQQNGGARGRCLPTSTFA